MHSESLRSRVEDEMSGRASYFRGHRGYESTVKNADRSDSLARFWARSSRENKEAQVEEESVATRQQGPAAVPY